MSMNKEAYLCLSAMLRAREVKMLTADRAARMLEASGFEESAKLLADCGYEDMTGLSAGEIDAALSREADAILQQTGAEIALINGGAIRVSIKKGDITYGDILTSIPYINEMCAIKVKGQAIADVLEHCVRMAPEPSGGFLQVSGISFDLDLDKSEP